MPLPVNVEDVNMRRNLEYLLDKITALENAKPSGQIIVKGSPTGHKWELGINDTNNTVPTLLMTDLGV